jgi:hypothetical protein
MTLKSWTISRGERGERVFWGGVEFSTDLPQERWARALPSAPAPLAPEGEGFGVRGHFERGSIAQAHIGPNSETRPKGRQREGVASARTSTARRPRGSTPRLVVGRRCETHDLTVRRRPLESAEQAARGDADRQRVVAVDDARPGLGRTGDNRRRDGDLDRERCAAVGAVSGLRVQIELGGRECVAAAWAIDLHT